MICKQQTKNKKTIKNIIVIVIQCSTLGSTFQKWLVYEKRTDLKHQLYEFLLGLVFMQQRSWKRNMILFLILALILPVLSRAILKTNGYSSYDRGFFNQFVNCTLIPKNGIKTHQCNKTKETDTSVNCVTENSTSSFSFLLYQASVVYLSF